MQCSSVKGICIQFCRYWKPMAAQKDGPGGSPFQRCRCRCSKYSDQQRSETELGDTTGALMARPAAALPNCLHGVSGTAAACQLKPAPSVNVTAMRPGRRPGRDALLAELSHGQHKWLVWNMYRYLVQTPLGLFSMAPFRRSPPKGAAHNLGVPPLASHRRHPKLQDALQTALAMHCMRSTGMRSCCCCPLASTRAWQLS